MAQSIYTRILAPKAKEFEKERALLDYKLNELLGGNFYTGIRKDEVSRDPENGVWETEALDYDDRKTFVRHMLEEYPSVPFIIHSDITSHGDQEYDGELDWHDGERIHDCPSYKDSVYPLAQISELSTPWDFLLLPLAFEQCPIDALGSWPKHSREWRKIREALESVQESFEKRPPIMGAVLSGDDFKEIAEALARVPGTGPLLSKYAKRTGMHASIVNRSLHKYVLARCGEGIPGLIDNDGDVECDDGPMEHSVSPAGDEGVHVLCWRYIPREVVAL